MTLEALNSLQSTHRTPAVSRLFQGVSGGSGAGSFAGTTGQASFAQLLNSRQTAAAGMAGMGSQDAISGAATGGKAPGRAGESTTDQLNEQGARDDAAAKHEDVEKAAEGLVSNALILPILKQVRRSMESANSVFSGGNGEKTFGPEFDMQIADRIAKSPRLGIKEALVQRMEKRNGLKATAATKGGTTTSTLDVHG